MKKSKIKIMVILLTIILISGIGVAVFMFNKPHINVAKSKSDIEVSAQLLIHDFETDEIKANSKYLEKIVEVTGVVSDVTINNKKGIVVIESNDAMGSVLCHFSIEEAIRVATLKSGEKISIKGICTGYLMDVVLVKCVIN